MWRASNGGYYGSKEEAKDAGARKDAKNLGNRTAWMTEEKAEIGPHAMGREILNGTKDIRLTDVKGEVFSSRGVITDSKVFNQPGAREVSPAADGSRRFAVRVLRTGEEKDGPPKWWIEEVVVRAPLERLENKMSRRKAKAASPAMALSVVGAVYPAVLAARMRPVDALRVDE